MDRPLTDHIEHIVVLMFENRSFDNVLGGLYPDLTRRGLYHGLLGNERNPLDPRRQSSHVTVFQGAAGTPTWIMPYPDPGESYSDMVEQIFGSDSSVLPSGVLPPMSGFAWNYAKQPPSPAGSGWPSQPPVAADIMQYFSDTTMPMSWWLAQQYAVCDVWFASGPVQTLANRTFMHTGTPSKVPNTNRSRIDNPDFTNSLNWEHPAPVVSDTTIFELLDRTWPHNTAPACSWTAPAEKPLNWKVYYHDVPLSALCNYVYQHWCYDYPYGGNVFSFTERFSNETNFEYDIKNGLLPKYSFIEPAYTNEPYGYGIANSNHPGGATPDLADPNGANYPPPAFVTDGEHLLKQVWEILHRHPKTFEKTLLVVIYDEHGGLFDHVPPGAATSPFHPRVDNFNYDRYGVRVPAILVNPLIASRTVYPARKPFAPVPNPPFDHCSVLSTVIKQFRLQGQLTRRVDHAPPLSDLITLAPSAAPPRGPAPHLPARGPRIAPHPIPPSPVSPRKPGPPAPRPGSLSAAIGPLRHLIEQSRRRKQP